MLTAAALKAPKFAAHIPGRVIEDAEEDETKFESVRMVCGTVLVKEENNDPIYWYKGRMIERLSTDVDQFGHSSYNTWMVGRSTFPTLKDAKEYLDRK